MAEVLRIDEDCVLYEGAPATPEARRRLVRRFLSDRLGVPESDLRLSTTSAGQPVIENGGHLAVSWAHRSCFLFIGVAEGLVGVDLELAEHDLPIGDLVAAFFCKNERRVMRRLAPPERLEAFLLLWTIREAYLKALGHGLDVPLAHDLDFSPILRSHPAQGYIAQTICGPGVARAHLISRRVPRFLLDEKCPTNLRDRLHHQHPNPGSRVPYGSQCEPALPGVPIGRRSPRKQGPYSTPIYRPWSEHPVLLQKPAEHGKGHQ